jgi:Flp pilus assembly protein TadG
MNATSAKQRSGVAATEFAVALPILMLLALACADFGRVMHHYQIVSNAARTGAEAGAMHKVTSFTRTSWEADVRARL